MCNAVLFTKRLKIRGNMLFWHDMAAIEQVNQALRADKVVLGTSDTVMGLLAPLTQCGFDRLNKIKGRQEKPYIVLVSDRAKISNFSSLAANPALIALMDYCWPGPLTLIVPAKSNVPDFMKSASGAIAVRLPRHEGLLALLDRHEGLFSTSANLAGRPVAQSIDDVDAVIKQSCELSIVDANSEPTILPSTILDVTGDKVRVLREGAYPINQLEQIYGKSFDK